MEIVSRLGYIALGVSDLVEAAEFYSRFIRLDLTEQIGNTAFMTTTTRVPAFFPLGDIVAVAIAIDDTMNSTNCPLAYPSARQLSV